MIVVDASALCAVCFREPEGASFRVVLLSNEQIAVSALNLWEARVSVARRLPGALEVLENLIEASGAAIASIGPQELGLAWAAWQRFGKGRHAAALNMGDCFAYATAKALDARLLYKGNDFSLTDIEAV